MEPQMPLVLELNIVIPRSRCRSVSFLGGWSVYEWILAGFGSILDSES